MPNFYFLRKYFIKLQFIIVWQTKWTNAKTYRIGIKRVQKQISNKYIVCLRVLSFTWYLLRNIIGQSNIMYRIRQRMGYFVVWEKSHTRDYTIQLTMYIWTQQQQKTIFFSWFLCYCMWIQYVIVVLHTLSNSKIKTTEA